MTPQRTATSLPELFSHLSTADLFHGATIIEDSRHHSCLPYVMGKTGYLMSASYRETLDSVYPESAQLAARGYQLERVDHLSAVEALDSMTRRGA